MLHFLALFTLPCRVIRRNLSLSNIKHTAVLPSRSIFWRTISRLPRLLRSLIPNSTRRSEQGWKKAISRSQKVSIHRPTLHCLAPWQQVYPMFPFATPMSILFYPLRHECSVVFLVCWLDWSLYLHRAIMPGLTCAPRPFGHCEVGKEGNRKACGFHGEETCRGQGTLKSTPLRVSIHPLTPSRKMVLLRLLLPRNAPHPRRPLLPKLLPSQRKHLLQRKLPRQNPRQTPLANAKPLRVYVILLYKSFS